MSKAYTFADKICSENGIRLVLTCFSDGFLDGLNREAHLQQRSSNGGWGRGGGPGPHRWVWGFLGSTAHPAPHRGWGDRGGVSPRGW